MKLLFQMSLLSLSLALSACGNAPPDPQPDTQKLDRLLAELEASARPQAKEKSFVDTKKAAEAERLVTTLDKSLPDDITETSAASILGSVG